MARRAPPHYSHDARRAEDVEALWDDDGLFAVLQEPDGSWVAHLYWPPLAFTAERRPDGKLDVTLTSNITAKHLPSNVQLGLTERGMRIGFLAREPPSPDS